MVDKREIKDFPKLPSVNSFIHRMLYEMVPLKNNMEVKR